MRSRQAEEGHLFVLARLDRTDRNHHAIDREADDGRDRDHEYDNDNRPPHAGLVISVFALDGHAPV